VIDLDVRIDTVTWEAPVGRCHIRGRSGYRARGIDTRTGEIASTTDFLRDLDLPGGVQATKKSRDQEQVLQFSGSLARVLDGHNVFGASIDDCYQAMRMVEEAMPMDRLSPFSTRRRIRRVDLVRDFWPVPDGPGLINSIAHDTTYRRTGSDHYETFRGRPSGTIYRGPKQAQSVLYDKPSAVAAAYQHLGQDSRCELVRLAEGRVRYELRLSREQLRSRIGVSLADIDEDYLLDEMHRRFREAHFDRAGVGVSEFLHRVAESDLTGARQVSLIGAALYDVYGINVLSAGTMEKNRRTMRDLGLVLDQFQKSEVPARLDFSSGIAVTSSVFV